MEQRTKYGGAQSTSTRRLTVHGIALVYVLGLVWVAPIAAQPDLQQVHHEEKVVMVGQTFVLRCNTPVNKTAKTKFVWTWPASDTRTEKAANDSLRFFVSVSIGASGQYQCLTLSNDGVTSVAKFTVTVVAKPSAHITVAPGPFAVGDSVPMRCSLRGMRELAKTFIGMTKVTWFHGTLPNRQEVVDSEAMRLSADGSLLTVIVDERSDWSCEVVFVTNNTLALTRNLAVDTVSLEVLEPPKVQPSEVTYNVVSGGDYEFHCGVTNASIPHVTTWQRQSSVLAQSSVLRLYSVNESMKGNYQCTTFHPRLLHRKDLYSSQMVSLNVIKPVETTITNQKPVQAYEHGERVILTCHATAEKGFNFNFQWFFNNSAISSGDDTSVQIVTASGLSRLVLQRPELRHEGDYRCQGNYPYIARSMSTRGSPPGASVFLHVHARPSVTMSSSTLFKKTGEDVTLTCFASGDEHANLTARWERKFGKDFMRIREPQPTRWTNNLYLPNVNPRDRGHYVCIVKDMNFMDADEVSAAVELFVSSVHVAVSAPTLKKTDVNQQAFPTDRPVATSQAAAVTSDSDGYSLATLIIAVLGVVVVTVIILLILMIVLYRHKRKTWTLTKQHRESFTNGVLPSARSPSISSEKNPIHSLPSKRSEESGKKEHRSDISESTPWTPSPPPLPSPTPSPPPPVTTTTDGMTDFELQLAETPCHAEQVQPTPTLSEDVPDGNRLSNVPLVKDDDAYHDPVDSLSRSKNNMLMLQSAQSSDSLDRPRKHPLPSQSSGATTTTDIDDSYSLPKDAMSCSSSGAEYDAEDESYSMPLDVPKDGPAYRSSPGLRSHSLKAKRAHANSPIARSSRSATVSGAGHRTAPRVVITPTRRGAELMSSNGSTAFQDVVQEGIAQMKELEKFASTSCDNSDSRSLSSFDERIYSEPYQEPPSSVDAIYNTLMQQQYRHIEPQCIELQHEIGSGRFGNVYRGTWKEGRERAVAVKTLKDDAGPHDRVMFLQEAAIMGQFRHKNLVRLFGVVTDGPVTMLVLELMSSDNLRQYLMKVDPGSQLPGNDLQHELLRMCREVANGMAYLAGRNFVHRDLAARNVMLDNDRVCKIGDFGMSRGLAEDEYVSTGGVIPVRWSAPEAIEFRQFSSASDVWSYGVVLFEIWSFGRRPYCQMSNEAVIDQLNEGYRLPRPQHCPPNIYSLITDCWEENRQRRPTFAEVVQRLSGLNEALLRFPKYQRKR